MKTYNLTENLFWTAALAILAGGGAVQTKRRNRMLRAVVCLAELAAGGAAWEAEGARMVFDRAGGFTAAAGEEEVVALQAVLLLMTVLLLREAQFHIHPDILIMFLQIKLHLTHT